MMTWTAQMQTQRNAPDHGFMSASPICPALGEEGGTKVRPMGGSSFSSAVALLGIIFRLSTGGGVLCPLVR